MCYTGVENGQQFLPVWVGSGRILVSQPLDIAYQIHTVFTISQCKCDSVPQLDWVSRSEISGSD